MRGHRTRRAQVASGATWDNLRPSAPTSLDTTYTDNVVAHLLVELVGERGREQDEVGHRGGLAAVPSRQRKGAGRAQPLATLDAPAAPHLAPHTHPATSGPSKRKTGGASLPSFPWHRHLQAQSPLCPAPPCGLHNPAAAPRTAAPRLLRAKSHSI